MIRPALVLSAFFSCFAGLPLFSQNGIPPAPTADAPLLKFEENKNQHDERVAYAADLSRNGKLFLEKNAFTYLFWNAGELAEIHHPSASAEKQSPPDEHTLHFHSLKATFIGANNDPLITASDPAAFYRNYFLGSDESKWAAGVKVYSRVSYFNLYPSIDLQVYSENGNLKYDFVVEENADASQIRISYSGAESMEISQGNLSIKTSLGVITELQPYAYQVIDGRKTEVKCLYQLKDSIVSFYFPNGYDPSQQLIIDPTLICSTYSGSNADNWGYTACYDAQGNIYAGGIAAAMGYPFTVGAFQTSFGGGGGGGNFYPFDVAITKFNTTGTALIYSTYLGGIDNEQPQSIVVDNSDQLCVIGRTWSGNFPVTAGAYDNSINGASDIFITKFNPAGTALIGSTFIGGSAEDGVNLYANFYVCDSLKFNYGDDGRSDIITDQAGNCYVASCTKSGNFPVTAGALQTVFGGGTQDGCVFKINSTLTSMIWSTYLGGSSNDAAYSIQLDATNTVYVAGGTSSTDFPATPGTIHPAYQGGSADGFATVIEPAGSFILTSSFIGTGFYDQVYFLQLDQSNNVYLFGQTQGSYPVTAGVYSNPNSGQFIHKLDPSLSSTFFSTVFGSGSLLPNISPCAFLVDTCENIYTSGWGGACIPWGNTGTTFGLPVTSNAFQSTTDGCDFYFFVLKKDAASLWYATFFGAPNPSEEHVDGGTSRFDKRGVIYQAVCAGCPGQSNFPTTPGAWSTTNGSSNCNLAVIKMDFDLINFSANASASPSDTICLGTNMNFLNTSVGAQNYIWDFGDGSPPDTSTNPSHLYNSAGIFVVTLVAIDSLSCIMSDTVQLFITVIAPPVVNLGNDSIFCTNPNLVLDAGNPGSAYLWSTGATTQTITVSSSGTYWVTVSNAVCADVDSITFQLLIPPNLGSDTILCAGLPLMLDAGNPGSAYQWNTGATSQTINVNASGIYTVTVTTPPCQYQDSINVTFVPIPIVDIGPDTLLCPGATLLLDAGNPGGIYSWNTGDSSQLITVNGNGIYGVLVSNGTCEESDSMQLQTIAPVNLGSDINLCDYVNVELSAPNVPGASYLWSTGAATSVINVYEAGTYWVTVNAGNCIINDTVNVDGGFSTGLYVPNCFTPNHDGKNDFFYAKGEDITDFHMMIFNRWGEKLFETMDMNESWSGNYNGEVVQIDVYVVVIEYTTRCSTKKIREFRHVTVER